MRFFPARFVRHLDVSETGTGREKPKVMNTEVARLFRESQRQRDSFLGTFTPAMLETAERFREEESLQWQQERAAQAKKGPGAF